MILLERIPTPSRVASNTSREETDDNSRKNSTNAKRRQDSRNDGRRVRTGFSSTDSKRLKNFLNKTSEYPDSAQIITLATSLGHDRYVIRVWFYNKRQNLKGKTSVRKRKKRVKSHQAERVEDLRVDEF